VGNPENVDLVLNKINLGEYSDAARWSDQQADLGAGTIIKDCRAVVAIRVR
jgi:hypothetical protein